MTIATQPGGGSPARPRPSELDDVADTILDKGLVIDACVRVSLVGIEVLTIDPHTLIASMGTHLRFAEAVSRLVLDAAGDIGAAVPARGILT
jgi:hypothetical protein